MMKYTGLNINKQDNNNTAEYDEIYRSKHKQTITILQNMIKYTGLNINKQDNNNTAEYDEIYRSKDKQTIQ